MRVAMKARADDRASGSRPARAGSPRTNVTARPRGRGADAYSFACDIMPSARRSAGESCTGPSFTVTLLTVPVNGNGTW
jgi:hypothetical protein